MQSFEALNQRAVAVVVDPVQSVKGKVVIDAFRLISPQTMMLGQEPRQTTSNLGHLNKPSIQVRQAGRQGWHQLARLAAAGDTLVSKMRDCLCDCRGRNGRVAAIGGLVAEARRVAWCSP